MIGYHQFVKLALGCILLATLLYVPGIIYAQEKNDLKLEIFDFPVSPNQIMISAIDNIRESGAIPPVGIMTMPAHQSPTHVILPYSLYNINDEANVIIIINPGNGIFLNHENLTATESDNHTTQFTSVRNTSLVGNNVEIWINACQDGLTNCSSVVIIVTVDGRPPKALAVPYNN